MTELRELRAEDWPDVARIFGEGIATRLATFETEVPAWERWDAGHLRDHRLVAVAEGRVVGWAAVAPVSARPVYAGVVEASVYVEAAARGRGVGRLLLGELVRSTDRAGIWTVQAGIFPENEASLRLHEALGFVRVGLRRRIARLDGVWRDVVLLERRSDAVD